MIHRSLLWSTADSDAQSRDLIRPKLNNDRVQAVVPTSAPVRAHPQPAKRQSKVIQNDQHLTRCYFVKLRDCHQWKAASIHEREWLYQYKVSRFCDYCLSLAELFPQHAEVRSQTIDHRESDIVSGLLVFRSGITQAGDETDLV